MRHRQVQRALVVMQHAARPRAALAELTELTDDERAALAAVDARALATDPLRCRKLLRTLAEEYKASTTLLLAATRRWADLEAFFASARFRDAIMQDRPLAIAFGEFVMDVSRPVGGLVLDVATLETARARCRRDASREPEAGVGTAPGVAVVRLDTAALPALHAAEQWLFEIGLMPQLALADELPRPELPPPSGTREAWLLAPSGGDIALSQVDAALASVLDILATTRKKAETTAALVAHGVPKQRVPELVAALVDDGLVVDIDVE